MRWLWDKKVFRSEKNGTITCRLRFGRWEVFVDGYHESSRLLRRLWISAMRRLPPDFMPKRILILGLCAGDTVGLCHERFPGCRITAVEWDPVMVEIADTVGTYPAIWRPEVLVADAADAVRKLAGPYDYIVVDLFHGGTIASAVRGTSFFDDLHRLLAPGGLVLVNAFKDPDVLPIAAGALTLVTKFFRGYNHLALFERKNTAADNIPSP